MESGLIHKKFTIRKCKKSASGLTVWRFFLVNESVSQTVLENDAADFAISIDCDGVQHRIKEIFQNLCISADSQSTVIDVGVPGKFLFKNE